MSLATLLQEIRSDLIRWQQAGLNESQTIQAIVLPILSALGWDWRNPFEVYPQKNSGGTSGGFIPDFTLFLDDQEKLLVEVKALNTNLSIHRAQAVNYANSIGHRWVVLTNGQEWEFLDNALQVPASEKLSLTIQTSDKKAEDYLEQVMSKAFWSKPRAKESLAEILRQINLDIRNRLKLSEIENKLRAELQEGFTKDIKGLKRAIELTLEANERELANDQLDELATRILGQTINPPSLEKGITFILRECMNLVGENAGLRSSDFLASMHGERIEARSWRDFHSGLAEVFLKLGRQEDLEQITQIYSTPTERLKANGEPYPESAYRKLSNGRWLYTHLSAKDHMRICNTLLKELSIPTKSIKILYRSEEFELPNL
ncbi:hypothetical protein [Meiothermus sp.]|jgi:predicted type IV restriction endonuclease|uniref:hypothetical protein n=1 Tax=Meiothermus sp. TaxID=1955249 RepID=UPI0021DD7553|nr:hypothetical protein [Meiothermus sp.]GIW25324.1 MAG: hypothetical protein KatS3mg069_1591 [Meiothermus sp.]